MGLFGPKKKKVLVTDDNFNDRLALRALLQEKGYEVLEAADGGPAIQLAGKYLPDLILLGDNMSLLSGETAVAIIRSHEKTKNIPIIMVSSNDSMSNVANCLSQGANDYVVKPFETDRLLAKVQGLLNAPRPT